MCQLRKTLRPQNHWKSVTYLTLVIFILRPYIDKLKWCINSEWAALGNGVTERAVGEWRQRPPLAFMLEDILSTCFNKRWCDVTRMTFWETIIANCVYHYSVNHFWADAKFLLDVACQKLLKSANVSRSYSKNKSVFLFWNTVYIIHWS